MRSFITKENHIGLAVSEILQYTKIDTHTVRDIQIVNRNSIQNLKNAHNETFLQTFQQDNTYTSRRLYFCLSREMLSLTAKKYILGNV